MLNNKIFKVFLVSMAVILMLAWAINYKIKSEKVLANGYHLYSLVEDIKYTSHQIEDSILKATLYRLYNYDNINDNIQKLIDAVDAIKRSNVYSTTLYPKSKEIIEKCSSHQKERLDKIELFKRENGQIKNSIVFISSSLNKTIDLSRNDRQNLLDAMSTVLNLNNSIGTKKIDKIDLGLSFFKNIRVNNETDKLYIKLFKTHMTLLERVLPVYIKLVNVLIDDPRQTEQFKLLTQRIENENSSAIKALDAEFYAIIIFGLLTLMIIVYYIFLTENEKQRIIKLQNAYKESITVDKVTGIKNRNAYNEALEYFDKATAIQFDISEFSSINNLYGVDAADFVLKSVAAKITKSIEKKENSNLFKVGSDQFVILMNQISDIEASELAQCIISNIEKSQFKNNGYDQPIHIQLHAGISHNSPYIINSDIALKSHSKKIAIFNNSLDKTQEIQKNITMIQKVKESIENDNITMLFQPIIDLKSKEIIKHEALVRLKDESKYISPYFFLDLSKKAKLYSQITHDVILKSFTAIKNKDVDISINLSIEDILHKETHDFIIRTLIKDKDVAKRVTFEILESEEIVDFELLKEFIKEVKSFGCTIAIDDFGSGYSNYIYLLELDVDILKIDGSLIKNIDKCENNQLVVKSIVEFAKLANIKTVAEFITSPEIEEIVTKLGIDYGQGYYYSEPKLL